VIPPKALLVGALLAVVLGLGLSAPALAAPPPPVDARAYLVVNGATGEVLAQRAARQRLPIASLTKLMTVLLTLDHTRPSAVATVPSDVTSVGESSIYLRAGERMSVLDLLEGALIPSANDAADTLAEYVGHGDDAAFVRMMNKRARRLGLTDTHYVRPDGLDTPGHVSSARDVTKLARIVMRRPLFRKIVRQTTATIAGGRTIYTRNNLLYSFPGTIGVKTGHTDLAGWSEVAAARRNGVTIYTTILHSPSEAQRDADLSALLSWGFSQYRTATLVQRGRTYAEVPTGFGRRAVRAVAVRRVVRPVRVGRPLVERVIVRSAAELPVQRGEPLGQIRFYDGDRFVAGTRLVAATSVSRPGFVSRVGWYIGRTFHHLLGALT
jgi:D-alanyl-D-alanine carboxypeptidase (penicillin-binding protein 5/6)